MSCRMDSTTFATSPAREFRPQGQYSACPRTACRGTTDGAGRSARAPRLAPTLSLLRRAYDHRRNLRAMAATTRAASRARTNREPHAGTAYDHVPPQHRCSECTGVCLSPGSARNCCRSVAAGSRLIVRPAKNLTHQVAAHGRTGPTSKLPQPRKTQNPHR